MGKGIPWITCLLAGRASALSPEPTHSSRLLSGSAGSHTHVHGTRGKAWVVLTIRMSGDLHLCAIV
jgi:hypothetical protein